MAFEALPIRAALLLTTNHTKGRIAIMPYALASFASSYQPTGLSICQEPKQAAEDEREPAVGPGPNVGLRMEH